MDTPVLAVRKIKIKQYLEKEKQQLFMNTLYSLEVESLVKIKSPKTTRSNVTESKEDIGHKCRLSSR